MNTRTETDPALRPTSLDAFAGQPDVADRLRTMTGAAKRRGEACGHLLFVGPPGLGKTSLARIVAQEMGAEISVAYGPMLTKPDQIADFLLGGIWGERSVLFIDEVHRVAGKAQDTLLSAMEDKIVTKLLRLSPRETRPCEIGLPDFTLIAATTRPGMIAKPMRDRFAATYALDFYTPAQLEAIVERSAEKLGFAIGDGAALEIALRSRGTPRIANHMLRRVRDYAQGWLGLDRADCGITVNALDREGVDGAGLDALDVRYLLTIRDRFNGGPAGLDAVAATMSADAGTLEELVEPYLLWSGFISRTAQGRVLTERAVKHLRFTKGGAR